MKWKILRTKENHQKVNTYFNKIKSNRAEYSATSGYCFSVPINDLCHVYSDTDGVTLFKTEDFIEITIDQFRSLFLESNYEIY